MYQHGRRLLDILSVSQGVGWPRDFFLTLVFNGDPEIGLFDIPPEKIETITVGVQERKYDLENQTTSLETILEVLNVPVGHA